MKEGIYNAQTDTIEVDLIGDFTDDWFSDLSKENILGLLNEYKDSNLIMNLSSLGGSVDTAFAVSDWVAKHSGLTTVRLLGRNASASTVFSTAFDKVEMSENGLFLVHNVWGAAVGESEELKKIAEDMEKHNEIIVNIFRKKTGKTKKQIKDLMNENKWITAQEAKAFGFVDKIFKPTDKQNKIDNKHKQTIFNKYLSIMGTEKKEGILIENEKGFFEKIANHFKPEIKDISAETKTTFENKIAILEAKQVELAAQNKAFEAEKLNAEKTILDLEAKNAAAVAKISELEKDNAKIKDQLTKEVATPTIEKNKEDKIETAGGDNRETRWANSIKRNR